MMIVCVAKQQVFTPVCSASRRLSMYLFCFIFLFLWGILNRIVITITGHTYFSLALLHIMFVPSQGFANAIVYGNLWKRVRQICCKRSKHVIMGTTQTSVKVPKFSTPRARAIVARAALGNSSLAESLVPSYPSSLGSNDPTNS
eukprot:c9947_g1_i7.p3 GENE.c9947_g1_i7~~c9947_g1_i7.p3  ORF type:complete len:144 (-),score=17.99 c9947_g1_i7:572-1003(-)